MSSLFEIGGEWAKRTETLAEQRRDLEQHIACLRSAVKTPASDAVAAARELAIAQFRIGGIHYREALVAGLMGVDVPQCAIESLAERWTATIQ